MARWTTAGQQGDKPQLDTVLLHIYFACMKSSCIYIYRHHNSYAKHNPEKDQILMANHHFVFVAGAGHGSWCWYKIRSSLEKDGHKVTCVDLKGQGINLTDPNTVFNLSDFNEPLIDFFSSQLSPDEKVILVGHSAGGLNITDILHRFPDRIHAAVYIAAIMYRNGIGITHPRQETLEYQGRQITIPFHLDCYKVFWEGHFVHIPFPTSLIIRPECQRKLLYNLTPVEDSTLASMLLRPHPILAMLLGSRFTENPKVDTIKRVYVRTMKDDFMTQESHDQMIAQWRPSKVVALESDHSPFFSTPSELYKALVEAAAA